VIADLDRPYALDNDQVEFFRDNGFVRLKQVFSAPEIEFYGGELTRLALALNTQEQPLAERSAYGKAFLQITNLWEQGRLAREFVFGKRLARIAADLLETNGVRLYHDQLLYKEAGGGFTPAHADQFYWPLASDRSVTAWVPLQAVPEEMGPIGFYAGSHRMEFGRDLPISDESEVRVSAEIEHAGFSLVTGAFELGEVSFHLGWTFHRAGPNLTDQPRSVMTVIYMDGDTQLKAPANRNEEIDRDAWCPGVEVGAVISTPKNPVLYEAEVATL
jgi:ectoine hydroxylase-related dioxygenase (phytanoyl-CoA dioxygenase family)